MNLEEAIKTAIEYETKVRGVYQTAEETATNPIGKRVFNTLVKEEQRHLDYLESRLEEWENSGEVTLDVLDTVIPSSTSIQTEVDKLKDKLDIKERDKKYTDVELQMLKKALEVENETSEFYKQMVLDLPDPEKQLFKRFVEIEEGHKAIVQAEIDSVTGMGYWFDMPEFNLASG
jgi:rubrerythrin